MKIELEKRLAGDGGVADYDVRQMKKALNRLGYYTPAHETGITGIPDAALFRALRKFQQENGIATTGVARPGDKTVQAVNKRLAAKKDGKYIWRTVSDGRVRPAHAKFSGTIRDWNNSPDPGDDFNCRCWAEPVPDDIAVIDDPPLRPVYPELVIFSITRAGKIVSIAREIFRMASSEPHWQVNASRRQLQKKFKHAKIFGIKGNPRNKTIEAYKKALQKHVDSPDTIVIKGTYHKRKVVHYYNPRTRINVMRNTKGEFLSAWELSDEQMIHVSKNGKLGGSK